MKEKVNIGKLIREGRIRLGLQQKDLAKRLGVKSATVSAWELNKINPSLSLFVEMLIMDVISLKSMMECIDSGRIGDEQEKEKESTSRISELEKRFARIEKLYEEEIERKRKKRR